MALWLKEAIVEAFEFCYLDGKGRTTIMYQNPSGQGRHGSSFAEQFS